MKKARSARRKVQKSRKMFRASREICRAHGHAKVTFSFPCPNVVFIHLSRFEVVSQQLCSSERSKIFSQKSAILPTSGWVGRRCGWGGGRIEPLRQEWRVGHFSGPPAASCTVRTSSEPKPPRDLVSSHYGCDIHCETETLIWRSTQASLRLHPKRSVQTSGFGDRR